MNSIPDIEADGHARRTGYGMVLLGIYLNIPFAALGLVFSYPEILRRPAGEILTRFAEGGPMLFLAGFVMLSAWMVVAGLTLVRRAARPARFRASIRSNA